MVAKIFRLGPRHACKSGGTEEDGRGESGTAQNSLASRLSLFLLTHMYMLLYNIPIAIMPFSSSSSESHG